MRKASYELNIAQPISLHRTYGKNETADKAQETFNHIMQSKLLPNLAWHCFIYIHLIVLNIIWTLVRRCYWKVWQKKERRFNILKINFNSVHQMILLKFNTKKSPLWDKNNDILTYHRDIEKIVLKLAMIDVLNLAGHFYFIVARFMAILKPQEFW